MINLDKEFPDLPHQLTEIGLFEKVSTPGNVIFFVKPLAGIAKFYQPDIMKRQGYVRLGGSIGLALIDKSLNGGLDFRRSLHPINGAIISIRLENFIDLMREGAFVDNDIRNTGVFVKKLNDVISDVVPDSLGELIESSRNTSSWIGQMMINMASNTEALAGRRVFSYISSF